MKNNILEKLKKILSEPIKNEYQVVYIIVEIRKLLEKIDRNKYGILRFYCHWALHSELNHLSPVREILNRIYEEHRKGDFKDVAFDFISFKYLKKEMIAFCKEDSINLPTEFLENYERWRRFQKIFSEIIKDSPLKMKPKQKPIFIEEFSLKECKDVTEGKSRILTVTWEYKPVDSKKTFTASIDEVENIK